MALQRRKRVTASNIEPSKDLCMPQSLRTWQQIPSWQQDNEYILAGYREATNSFGRCYQSLGYIHNETINIYSHILGAMIFFFAPIYIYIFLYSRYPQVAKADVVVFSTFFYGVAICFSLSST